MTLTVELVIHPYTARKDTGAGHDRYAYELLARLPRWDVNVTEFASREPTGIATAFVAEAMAIPRLVARRRVTQVFHATATMNAMAPITARARPLVTTIHDVLWFFVRARFDSKLKYRLKTFGIRRAARRSDKLIVPFASTREFLIDELKVPRDRIHVVRYGVDHDAFHPPADGEQVPRPKAFDGIRGPVVLFVGATNVGKGVDTLIEAFPDVIRRVPDATLVIGSKGWDTPALEALHARSPARDKIRFAGFIPEAELRAAYIHAAVCVFPSRYGFGLPTLESMACGTPTVSGRTLDAPEFVGDAGLMTDPESPAELAAQIIRLLTEPSLHRELAAKGRDVSRAYTWDETARGTAEVYRTLA